MRSLISKKKSDLSGVIYLVASIAAFAIFLLILGYIGVTIAQEVKTQINSTNDDINNAFNTTINVSSVTLPALWYILFAGLLLGLFITSWFMNTHPIFIPIFIVLLAVAVIVGIAMSNAYEELSAVSTFSTAYSQQGAIGFLMGNLPYVALIVGLISLLITFAKPGGQSVVPM